MMKPVEAGSETDMVDIGLMPDGSANDDNSTWKLATFKV